MDWSPDEARGVLVDDLLYGPEPEGDPWAEAGPFAQAVPAGEILGDFMARRMLRGYGTMGLDDVLA